MGIEFKIEDQEYRIEKDPYCWILQRRAKEKEGTTRKGDGWINDTYHNTLHSIAAKLIDKGIKLDYFTDNGTKTLNTVTKEVGNAIVAAVALSSSTIDS